MDRNRPGEAGVFLGSVFGIRFWGMSNHCFGLKGVLCLFGANMRSLDLDLLFLLLWGLVAGSFVWSVLGRASLIIDTFAEIRINLSKQSTPSLFLFDH